MPSRAPVVCGGIRGLVGAQLLFWPEPVRRILQPGFAHVMPAGWASLSLAPWSTVQVAVSVVIAGGVALGAARMAAARSGLPVLLGLLAGTCAVLAVSGFADEAGAPEKVLLVRDNTGGGVYGPFVNRNHFAQAIELTLPAAVVLLAAGARRFGDGGLGPPAGGGGHARRHGDGAVGLCRHAPLRLPGRHLFLVIAVVVTLPLLAAAIGGPGPGRGSTLLVVVLAVAGVLASTVCPPFQSVSAACWPSRVSRATRAGISGRGTWRSWRRAPLLGSGLGSYRYVIGLDKPATGHRGARAGPQRLAGVAVDLGSRRSSGILAVAIAAPGVPAVAAQGEVDAPRVPVSARRRRSCAWCRRGSTRSSDSVCRPRLNRYLLAAWVGLVWGLAERRASLPKKIGEQRPDDGNVA